MDQPTRDAVAADALTGAPFIALLNRIEAELPLKRFRAAGLNYWPLMRFLINAARTRGQPIVLDLPQPDRPARRQTLRKRLKRWLRPPPSPLDLLPFDDLGRTDALFLNRSAQYVELDDGRKVQPYTDRLRLLVEDLADCRTVLMPAASNEAQPLQVEASTLPDVPPHRPVHLRHPRSRTERRQRARVLTHLATVNALLDEAAPMMRIDPETLLYRIEQTVRYRAYFRTMLRIVRPRVIFVSSFSGVNHLCAAAKEEGVVVVDLQHGGMHPHHPIAGHWAHRPPKGYELLPDLFWCWTDAATHFVGAEPAHRAVAGGNPSLSYLVRERGDTRTHRPSDGRKVVLFALQYGRWPLLAPHVMDAYYASRDRIEWRFRLHPIGWDRLPEAAETLDLPEGVIASESRKPLDRALHEADLVLTNMSTVVREAVEFGVPAAVCTDAGAALMDDLLRDGALSRLHTKADVLAAVLQDKPLGGGTRTTTSADPAWVRQTFRMVMDGRV